MFFDLHQTGSQCVNICCREIGIVKKGHKSDGTLMDEVLVGHDR